MNPWRYIPNPYRLIAYIFEHEHRWQIKGEHPYWWAQCFTCGERRE